MRLLGYTSLVRQFTSKLLVIPSGFVEESANSIHVDVGLIPPVAELWVPREHLNDVRVVFLDGHPGDYSGVHIRVPYKHQRSGC